MTAWLTRRGAKLEHRLRQLRCGLRPGLGLGYDPQLRAMSLNVGQRFELVTGIDEMRWLRSPLRSERTGTKPWIGTTSFDTGNMPPAVPGEPSQAAAGRFRSIVPRNGASLIEGSTKTVQIERCNLA